MGMARLAFLYRIPVFSAGCSCRSKVQRWRRRKAWVRMASFQTACAVYVWVSAGGLKGGGDERLGEGRFTFVGIQRKQKGIGDVAPMPFYIYNKV